MRRIAFLLLFVPVSAFAQGQPMSAQEEAYQQRILALTSESLNWQTQAIAERRRADDLQKQLDAAKKPAIPAK